MKRNPGLKMIIVDSVDFLDNSNELMTLIGFMPFKVSFLEGMVGE